MLETISIIGILAALFVIFIAYSGTKKQQLVTIGSKWVHNTKNPFDQYTVDIVDINNGYVKYSFPNGYTNSANIAYFVEWYRPISK